MQKSLRVKISLCNLSPRANLTATQKILKIHFFVICIKVLGNLIVFKIIYFIFKNNLLY